MLHLDNIDRYMVYVVNNALAEGLATPSRVNHFRGRNLGVRGWMEAQNHTEDRRDPYFRDHLTLEATLDAIRWSDGGFDTLLTKLGLFVEEDESSAVEDDDVSAVIAAIMRSACCAT